MTFTDDDRDQFFDEIREAMDRAIANGRIDRPMILISDEPGDTMVWTLTPKGTKPLTHDAQTTALILWAGEDIAKSISRRAFRRAMELLQQRREEAE